MELPCLVHFRSIARVGRDLSSLFPFRILDSLMRLRRGLLLHSEAVRSSHSGSAWRGLSVARLRGCECDKPAFAGVVRNRRWPPEWLVSITVLVAAAVSWVAITGAPAGASGPWRNQISSLALAAHIVWITAGLAVYGILTVWRAAGEKNSSVPADTVGTVVLTGLSLALAWAGTHWRKRELVWLLYGVMALGGYKLVVRDFINEHNLALVVSLLCYGGALIVLPRMLRGESGAR